MRPGDGRRLLGKLALTALAWWVVGVIAFPLFWMVSSSLKPNAELLATPPTLWPSTISLEHYRRVLERGDFPTWFANSVVVAAGTMALVVVVATLGAYSLTRFRYPGRDAMAVAVLFTYFFPSVLMIIPLFLLFGSLRLIDTHLGLILANATFALPFALWLLREYFAAMPAQLEEAALVDGAPRLAAFVEVVVPQALPGIISTAIFTFVLAWNDYLFPLILITSNARKTLPVGVATYARELNPDLWGPLMAISVATTVPGLLFFIALQRRLVGGFGAGAVKG